MDIVDKMISGYTVSKLPKSTAFAMAYVPFQQEAPKTYPPVQALEAGTVFPELHKPFYGKKCGEHNE